MKNALMLLSLGLLLPTCCGLSTLMPEPTRTPRPSPSATAALTSTPVPYPTSTPKPRPTITPLPSDTPGPSPTPTRTPSPTIAPTMQPELDCQVVSQSLKYFPQFKPKEFFSAGWSVTNTGTLTWTPETVEFVYVSGTRMAIYPVVHLKNSVAPGQTVGLTVDMKAPKDSTKYTSTWALRGGDKYFCFLTYVIYVK